MERKKRFKEIDFLKGIAIITMVISHIFYFKYQLNMSSLNFNSWWYILLTVTAQVIFISCIGINLSLSYNKYQLKNQPQKYYQNQVQRAFIIGFFGLLLSYFTYITHGYKFIKFGILHFASCAILLLMWTVQYDLFNLLFIIFIATLYFIKDHLINFSLQTMPKFLIFILGIFNPQYYSIDYFPIIPWTILVAFGILVGNILYPKFNRRFTLNQKIDKFIHNPRNKFSTIINFLGQHSFLIYLIHIPILYVILQIIKKSS